MNFAVINPDTKKVENIINAESKIIDELAHGMGMRIECCQDFCLDIGDDFNPDDGKFYRDGKEVPPVVTIGGQIQAAIDSYTLELIQGGIL